MTTQLRFLALMSLATLGLAACGEADDASTDTDTDTETDVDTDTDVATTDFCDITGITCEPGDMLARLSGTITTSFTMTPDWTWVLEGGVFIDDGATLTINAGTTIFGDNATDGFLVIDRGAKIKAMGTASAPIVFTSSQLDGSRGRSDWGGLVINGAAPSNNCPATGPCDLPGEAGSGTFGGDQPGHSSGELHYVRVEFAGTLINDAKEINGIAFQGVGSGTIVDHIHAHMCADDGVEFFGGTVSPTHVIVTGSGDDGIDWTDGWTGSIQYAVVQHHGDSGDNGMECDNNEESDDATPRSAPKLQNLTIIGGVDGMGNPANDEALLLREGTGVNIAKAVFMRYGDACGVIDDVSTFANAWGGSDLNGNLAVTDSYFYCPDASVYFANGGDAGMPAFDADDFFRTLNSGNVVGTDPEITDLSETAPNYLPMAGSPLLGHSGGDLPGMEATDFIGAMGATDWTSWTSFPAN